MSKESNYYLQFNTRDDPLHVTNCIESSSRSESNEFDCSQVYELLEKLNASGLRPDFREQKQYLEKLLSSLKRTYNILDNSELQDDTKIQSLVNDVLLYLKKIEGKYFETLEIYVNIVESIFQIVDRRLIGSVIWASKYRDPIYIVLENATTLYTDAAKKNLIAMLSEITNSTYSIRKIAGIQSYNPLFDKCNHLMVPNGLLSDDVLQKMLSPEIFKEFKKLREAYPALSHPIQIQVRGGSDPNSLTKVSDPAVRRLCNPVDECNNEIPVVNQLENNYSMYLNLVKFSYSALETTISAIGDTIKLITRINEILEKISRIIKIFSRANIQSYDTSKGVSCSVLYEKTIINCIDITFLQILSHILIEQMQVDKYDQFSIDRIMLNVVNDYLTMSQINKPYIYIPEQIQDTRTNIILLLSIFNCILSNLDKFYIPSSMLNTISLPYLFGMTNRRRVTFPDESLMNQCVNYVINITAHYKQYIFKFNNSTGILRPLYGSDILIEIDKSTDNVVLYK
jgi:hypothetical protein